MRSDRDECSEDFRYRKTLLLMKYSDLKPFVEHYKLHSKNYLPNKSYGSYKCFYILVEYPSPSLADILVTSIFLKSVREESLGRFFIPNLTFIYMNTPYTQTTPIQDQISSRSKIIWWKGANLEFLRSLWSSLFHVPSFVPISDFSPRNIAHVGSSFPERLLAVRSSWVQEDHENGSMAGTYKTILNVLPSQISHAISEIHGHSLKKTGEIIPVTVQEMVDAEVSGVALSYDIDKNKAYTVIQIGNGNGESLVSWEQTGQTYKIHRYTDPKNIPDERLRALFLAITHLTWKYYTRYIDVEFAFMKGSNIPYILQIRPVANNWIRDHHEVHIPGLMYRYARMIAHRLQKSDDVYGNMIDINPEELIGSQPVLIQSFFNTIFPETSLKAWRAFLWYGGSEKLLSTALAHPYISLKNDIRLFLPKDLDESIVSAFQEYYLDFIKQNPSEQSSLDTRHYPNTQKQLEHVLSHLDLSPEQKEETRIVFRRFFSELRWKLIRFDEDIEAIQGRLFEKIGSLTGRPVDSLWDLTAIQDLSVSPDRLEELVKLIQDCTYMFVIAARGAFYFSCYDPHIDEAYFKAKKYESSIYRYMQEQGPEKIGFASVEGFNFLRKLTSEYTIEWLQSIGADTAFPDSEWVNLTSRFMVHRENIKYLFSRLFLILHNSIPDLWRAAKYRNFERLIQDLVAGIEWVTGKNEREYDIRDVDDMLIFPSVMHRTNHPLFMKLSSTEPHYIGNWILRGRILSVKHVSELEGKDLTGVIVAIENATPEIDIFLPEIEGILTKNGWPLAHIVIRAREYGIPAVVWMGENFHVLEAAHSIEIDFDKKKMQFA